VSAVAARKSGRNIAAFKRGSGVASTHPFLVLEQWPRRLPHIRHRPAS